MALGKDIDEIHKMPYPRWRSWQLFFLLEPWGWENNEYLFASIVTMINNVNQSKKGKQKKVDAFMRNPEKAVLDYIKTQSEADKYAKMSREEKREYALTKAQELFGVKK